MSRDLLAAALSAVWVLLVIGLAEGAHRRGMDRRQTRKIVHVGIGLWILPTYLLFAGRWWAVAPAAGFVLVNALSHRRKLIRSMEGEERSIGTILYPLSVALLLALSWSPPWRAVGAAGVLVMALGDAAASLVGRRWGRRIYRIAGHPRSVEGSLAMGIVSFGAVLLAYAVLGPALSKGIVGAALAVALVATLLEAISLWGLDNLLVPLGSALTLWLLHGRAWG